MTEMGLNLLDLKYKNNLFETINCKDFIDRKIILNSLKNDIRLLIDEPEYTSKKKTFKNKKNQTNLIKTKQNSKSTYYFYGQNNELCRIIQTKQMKFVDIKLKMNNMAIPELIGIKHKRIKLNINLKLIENK